MAITVNARVARNEFRKKYGFSAKIIPYIVKGWDSKRIAQKFGVSVGTVATIRSNFTRARYAPYAVHGGGTCCF